MGYDFVEHTILEMFNEQETIQDKRYFCNELNRILRDLESGLEKIEVKADLIRKYENPVEAENQENFCN